MRALLTPLVIASVLAGARPIQAASSSRPAQDPRVSAVTYNPQGVVRIFGRFRTVVELRFADDETIQHVAIGDATAWDVAVDKNVLFLKLKAQNGDTNLIVTSTRASGQGRTYVFDLTADARRKTVKDAFVLRFDYPDDAKTRTEAALSAGAQALRLRLTALQLDRGALEGHRNLDYSAQGAGALQPSEVSDNGRFTLLRFPAGQPVPALYQVTADGTESLVPFDVRGEFVVVHGVAAQFRLRRGRDVLCLYRRAPDPYGVNLGTHTASPAVDRVDRSAPAIPPSILGPDQ